MTWGYKTGGRKKGTRNKIKAEEERATVLRLPPDTGLTPKEFFLAIMRDETQDLNTRMFAGKAAAPYCHARLVDSTIRKVEDLADLSDAELFDIIQGRAGNDTQSRPDWDTSH